MSNQIKLGKSDVYVHPIGLGTNAVGGHNLYPNTDEAAGKKLVHTALENGITMLDTAFMYGLGRSEELIGEVIKERGNRSDVVIATKVAHKFVDDQMVLDNSPAFLRDEVEKSLQRLQTDYIDLLYIHYPDQNTPKAEAVGELKRLKDEGKIRAIGLSNFTPEQLEEANYDGYVDVFQGEYHLLNRQAEKTYFPYTIQHQITYIPYFPLASGLLSGKYTAESSFNDFRSSLPYFQADAFIKNLEKVEQLRKIASAKQAEIAHIVLAWYLTQEAIEVLIPGAKNAEQVIHNLKTLDIRLTTEEVAEIDLIFKA